MRDNLDTLSPANLLLGWLLALQSMLLTLVVAVIGQGLGAWTGGCEWIGISLPVDRQVWALVNQPNLAFSSGSTAFGYWLGSVLVPLLGAAAVILLFTRAKTFNAELMVIHWSWFAAVFGAAWMPMIDQEDGHLHRWLHFRELPELLVWTGPVLALVVASLAALRLLALTRAHHPHAGRWRRLVVVVLHLLMPTAAAAAGVSFMRQELLLEPTVAVILVMLPVLVLIWFRYPAAPVHAIREPRMADHLRALVVIVVLAALCWIAGRPVADGGRAGLLWSRDTATNNIRGWIDARPLLPQPVPAEAPSSKPDS